MDAAQDKLQVRLAADVCAVCPLETDVAGWLRAEPNAATLLQQLLDGGATMDAVRFLCHAIEPREAVWLAWDVVCSAASGGGVGADDPATLALQATSAWLVDPSDENRREAHAAGERCGHDKAAGCVALAVFLAEGSLGPADLDQEVPPPPGACAKAAAGALIITAVQAPERAAERAGSYVARWSELAPLPRPWDQGEGQPSDADASGSGYDTDLKF